MNTNQRRYYLIRCTTSGAVIAGAFLSSAAWLYIAATFGSRFGKYLAESHAERDRQLAAAMDRAAR